MTINNISEKWDKESVYHGEEIAEIELKMLDDNNNFDEELN
jgi:hypothetical protein